MTPDATLRTRLEGASLTGLAEAAEAMLGDDPSAVTGVLADWREQGKAELPRVTARCWLALTPIGGGRPPGAAPLALDELLAGAPTEQQAAADALRDCRDRADRVPPPPSLPSGGADLLSELWRRALSVAVVDFWANVATLVTRVRPAVVAGDHAEATRALGAGRAELRAAIDRIEMLANRASTAAPAATVGEAPPPAAPPPAAREPRPRRRIGVGQWAPVAFLVLTTVLAVGVLYAVLQR